MINYDAWVETTGYLVPPAKDAWDAGVEAQGLEIDYIFRKALCQGIFIGFALGVFWHWALTTWTL